MADLEKATTPAAGNEKVDEKKADANSPRPDHLNAPDKTDGLSVKEENVVEDTGAHDNGITPVFYAKVECLNQAIREIGMGRYQWELFISADELPLAASSGRRT